LNGETWNFKYAVSNVSKKIRGRDVRNHMRPSQ